MNTTTNPNSAGSASLATTGAGELERLRFVLGHLTAWTQWWTHYEDLNFRDRMVRNHLLVVTATNTRSMARGEMTGAGEGVRFHAVAYGFVNQGVHHETALLRYHVNTTTMALLLSLGGDLHLGGTLKLGSPGAASHAALFLGAHTNTGLFWPANDALSVTIKGGTTGGGELVRFHTGGLMAGVNASYDIGTGSGSRFRHLHLTGSLVLNTSVTAGSGLGDIITRSTAGLRGVNTAGDSTLSIARIDANNFAQLGGATWAESNAPKILYDAAVNFIAGDVSRNGAIGVDATNNRFIFYSGGARYYVTGTSF